MLISTNLISTLYLLSAGAELFLQKTKQNSFRGHISIIPIDLYIDQSDFRCPNRKGLYNKIVPEQSALTHIFTIPIKSYIDQSDISINLLGCRSICPNRAVTLTVKVCTNKIVPDQSALWSIFPYYQLTHILTNQMSGYLTS